MEDEVNKIMCSCHQSIEDHFDEVAKKEGVDVAKVAYRILVRSMLETQKEIMKEKL